MKIEVKTENTYSKTEYVRAGKVGYLANRIDEVINWLKEKKINADISRYSRYKQYILDFSANHLEESGSMKNDLKKILLLSDFEEMYAKSAEAIREIYQIVYVYDQFKDEKSKGLNERLRKIVSGKDFYDREENDQGRDFLYELVIAAEYKKKGYGIVFDSVTQTDVIAKSDDIAIYIESKRLKSDRNYERNYRKACNQLKKVDDENAIKLVYVDIYNCLKSTLMTYEYSDFLDVNNFVTNCLYENFKKPNEMITQKVLNEFSEYVDGVAFTAIGTFGVNYLYGIEIDIYSGTDVMVPKSISYDRYAFIQKALGRKS